MTDGAGKRSRKAAGMQVLLLRKEGEEKLGGVAMYKPQECRGGESDVHTRDTDEKRR